MKRLIRGSRKNNIIKMVSILKELKGRTKSAMLDIDETVTALSSLTEDNDNSRLMGLKSQIKKEEPDCIYNGIAYRKLIFNLYDIGEGTISKKELEDNIRSLIETGYNQSFSDNLDSCKDFDPDSDGSAEIIIKTNIKDAINVHKLLEKYYNITKDLVEKCEEMEFDEYEYGISEEDLYECYNSIDTLNDVFQKEKEVIGVLKDYEIEMINGRNFSSLNDEIEIDEL